MKTEVRYEREGNSYRILVDGVRYGTATPVSFGQLTTAQKKRVKRHGHLDSSLIRLPGGQITVIPRRWKDEDTRNTQSPSLR